MSLKEITRASPERVWQSWVKAHAVNGSGDLVEGSIGQRKGKGGKGFSYQIVNVIPGSCFSISWKTLFVRLVFHHSVSASRFGTEIQYGFSIQGLFAWPVRWLLGKKIQQNLSLVLKAFVKQLEMR